MENEPLELFKLDEIDRKVFFWLIARVKVKAIKSWIEYIQEEYRRKQVIINSNCLFIEGLSLAQKLSTDVSDNKVISKSPVSGGLTITEKD